MKKKYFFVLVMGIFLSGSVLSQNYENFVRQDLPFFGLLQGIAVIVLIILIYLALNRKNVKKKSKRKVRGKN